VGSHASYSEPRASLDKWSKGYRFLISGSWSRSTTGLERNMRLPLATYGVLTAGRMITREHRIAATGAHLPRNARGSTQFCAELVIGLLGEQADAGISRRA
jgi:hypothetical protein